MNGGNIGDNPQWRLANTYIFEKELKFFEEVFDEDATSETKTFTYNDKEWIVVAPHPTQDNYTIVIDTFTSEIDCFENCVIENCVKPKSWQEQLCEEFEGLTFHKDEEGD